MKISELVCYSLIESMMMANQFNWRAKQHFLKLKLFILIKNYLQIIIANVQPRPSNWVITQGVIANVHRVRDHWCGSTVKRHVVYLHLQLLGLVPQNSMSPTWPTTGPSYVPMRQEQFPFTPGEIVIRMVNLTTRSGLPLYHHSCYLPFCTIGLLSVPQSTKHSPSSRYLHTPLNIKLSPPHHLFSIWLLFIFYS